MTVDEVVHALGGGKRSGSGRQCRCPAHNDLTASLHVQEGRNGGVVLYCHAGCRLEDVVSAAGLLMEDLRSPSHGSLQTAGSVQYPYTDETGHLLYTVHRYPGKEFRQQRADGRWSLDGCRRVLYRLPEVAKQVAAKGRVYVVEGEKDADRLASLGLIATTGAGGAKGWRNEYGEMLKGAQVIVLPDNDEPGRAYAKAVIASVGGAKVVTLPELPEHGDVSDWLEQGHDVDELTALAGTVVYKSQRASDLLRDPTLLRPPTPVLRYIAFAGRATLLAAREKSGKSTLMASAAAAITCGQGFCGTEPSPPADVLWVTFEEAKADVLRRFMQYKGDPDRLFLATGLEVTSFDSLAHESARPGLRLVILDTVAAYGYHTGTIEDENDAMEMTAALQPIVALAHEGTAAWVLLAHANKAGGYRGSTAGGAAVDVILEMEEGDGTGRNFKPRARWQISPFSLTMEGGGYRSAGAVDMDDESRVLRAIRAYPGTSREQVYGVARGHRDRVLACIDRLVTSGLVENRGVGRQTKLYLREQLPLVGSVS